MTDSKSPGHQPDSVAATRLSEDREHALRRVPRARTPRPPQGPGDRVGGAGYAADFLAEPTPAPTVAPELRPDVVRVDGAEVIGYTHFSVCLSRSRRLARWVAWNVDGATVQDLPRTGLRFRLDPRVPADCQLGDELYADNRIDRGHLARRRDLCWGSRAEAQRANSDSFCFTNVTPQVDDFNQSRRSGIWGLLEDALFEAVEVDQRRICVFAGPVLAADDVAYRGVRLPREHWKVICYVDAGRLEARAFLLSQGLDRLEGFDLARFRTYQITLSLLTARTGVRFDPRLVDRAEAALPLRQRAIPLLRAADIRW